MRHLELILPGTAIEVSTALTLCVRDVRKVDREIEAPGTKTYNRHRVVHVAEFAWDAVLELMKGKLPDAPLFDRIPHRWRARDDHAATVTRLAARMPVLVIPKPYTLRDHRHTWAVRAVRGGWPIHAVAEQLGHANGVLALKVYGRFQPKSEERARWEGEAQRIDERAQKGAG